jgi:hypothetical protein
MLTTKLDVKAICGRVSLQATGCLVGLVFAAAVAIAQPARADFGITPGSFLSDLYQEDGTTHELQAGGHPYEQTTSFAFNSTITNAFGRPVPDGSVRDVDVELPAGFAGNPEATPKCPRVVFGALGVGVGALCPAASQVGVAEIVLVKFAPVQFPAPVFRPVYNVEPRQGDIADLGIVIVKGAAGVHIVPRVRGGGDYGLTTESRNISAGFPIYSTKVTIWGVPADPSHDEQRVCNDVEEDVQNPDLCPSSAARTPFLTSPSVCGLKQTTGVVYDSWQEPTNILHDSYTSEGGLAGCGKLSFHPSVSVRPQTEAADSPTGLDVRVHVPQDENPDSLATPPLRTAVVALPDGLSVNPASADGLGACTPAQIGLHSDAPVGCPDSSKLGTVTVRTPALPDPIEGALYLASQNDNPFKSLIAAYMVLDSPERGLLIKLAGRVDLSDSGRVTATFDESPQFPVEDVELHLKDGPRAALSTPAACGTFSTTSQLTPWSAPGSGQPATPSDSFQISSGANGTPCGQRGFAPGFKAGTTNPVAGGFSPVALKLTRTDADGEFRSLSSLSLPKGLLANVASIATRCTIQQADAHSCPAASHIGEVTAGAGAGPSPFYAGGDVYLTGPYKGNPFGIAVAVHAQAGPIDLGYVVVKGAIQIHDDGSVTVATDQFPTILQGIPLQIRDIRVNLDRPGFVFNPTSCEPLSINATAVSTAGQQAGVSSRFQVGECANLAFKPVFTASTTGKTSKADGASLHVHLATHQGPTTPAALRESDIAKVDVQLPVVLPSRLSTLQKACTAAQFAANPGGCPEGSFVGSAIAHTPILASPLSGPAILVSHGGGAFPDLVLVLQGEGVRIDLTGHTQIKKGITYSHFETVPDAPVSSFDLTLPQGPHAVLAANVPGYDLCAKTKTSTVTRHVTRRSSGHTRKVTVKARKTVATSLLMPTTITAQNGAVVHQNTRITVTGCATAKTAKHTGKKKSN